MGIMKAYLYDKAMNLVTAEQLPQGQSQHPGVILFQGNAYVFSREQGIQEMVYIQADLYDMSAEVPAEEAPRPVSSAPTVTGTQLPKQEAPHGVAATPSEASPSAEELKQEKLQADGLDSEGEEAANRDFE